MSVAGWIRAALCLGFCIPTIATASNVAAQDPVCSTLRGVSSLEIPEASRSERRAASALLREWPHGPISSEAEQRERAQQKDVIVGKLHEEFGPDLPRVLLALLSPANLRNAPWEAQAAADAYVRAGLSDDLIKGVAASATSNALKTVLFRVLRDREEGAHTVSEPRALLVCQLATEIMEAGRPDETASAILSDFLYALRMEAEKGSIPARALLADRIVNAAAERVRTAPN